MTDVDPRPADCPLLVDARNDLAADATVNVRHGRVGMALDILDDECPKPVRLDAPERGATV